MRVCVVRVRACACLCACVPSQFLKPLIGPQEMLSLSEKQFGCCRKPRDASLSMATQQDAC